MIFQPKPSVPSLVYKPRNAPRHEHADFRRCHGPGSGVDSPEKLIYLPTFLPWTAILPTGVEGTPDSRYALPNVRWRD